MKNPGKTTKDKAQGQGKVKQFLDDLVRNKHFIKKMKELNNC